MEFTQPMTFTLQEALDDMHEKLNQTEKTQEIKEVTVVKHKLPALK